LLELQERVAAIGIGVGVIGFERERRIEGGQGLARALHVQQDVAFAIQGIGLARIDPQGKLKQAQRLGQVAALGVDGAEQRQGVDVRGRRFEDGFERRFGLVQLAGFMERQSLLDRRGVRLIADGRRWGHGMEPARTENAARDDSAAG
jgi:hypothetical protein